MKAWNILIIFIIGFQQRNCVLIDKVFYLIVVNREIETLQAIKKAYDKEIELMKKKGIIIENPSDSDSDPSSGDSNTQDNTPDQNSNDNGNGTGGNNGSYDWSGYDPLNTVEDWWV